MLTELSWVPRRMPDPQPEDLGLEAGICILNALEEPGPWPLRGKSLGFLFSEPAEGPLWGFFLREGMPTMPLVGCMAASPGPSRKGLEHPFPSEPPEPGSSPTPSPELATCLSEPQFPLWHMLQEALSKCVLLPRSL